MNSLTGVTQRIISSAATRISCGSSRSRLELIGMLDERVQPAGDRRAGGVVARGGDDDVVGHGVHVGQRLAVDARVGDGRGEVLGRVFAPRCGQRGEVPEQVVQHRQLVLLGCAPRWNSASSLPKSSWV